MESRFLRTAVMSAPRREFSHGRPDLGYAEPHESTFRVIAMCVGGTPSRCGGRRVRVARIAPAGSSRAEQDPDRSPPDRAGAHPVPPDCWYETLVLDVGIDAGATKSRTGVFARAAVMKSCQISAGIDPPKTDGSPSTLSSGRSPPG